MDPMYKNMQPYPYLKEQMNYGPHYYPGIEVAPAQTHMNMARPPINYGCWPWGSNYGYPSPVGCHGCCSHTHFPTHYAWGSPYSQVPPLHCPGSYPSFPFPVQYMPPPPCYGMEQPRYEYDKNVPRDHHHNHSFHQRDQKNVRIEEEEPEKEQRTNDTPVPFRFKNMPSPIVWLPPDYSDNKEQGKVNNSRDWREGSLVPKAPGNGKNVEQKPTSWNGWYPLDLNSLVSSKPKGDEEANLQQDDSKDCLPFPLFWMPYKPEEKEMKKYKVNDANVEPVSESRKDSGGEENFDVNGENVGRVASGTKDIPLKEVPQHEEKESSKAREKETSALVKESIDSGEKKLDNGEKKLPKDGAKRKSPSPPKSSKLPPVCLRVDPLPRRKSANGSSRSPSPPGDKQKPDTWSNEASKVLNPSDNKKLDTHPRSEFKETKGTKTIEVVDGNVQQRKGMNVNMETPVKIHTESQNDVSTNQKVDNPKVETISERFTETGSSIKDQSEEVGSGLGKNEESFTAKEVIADETMESRKRELSEEEAAVIIQSAYRGFDTRRWEPIKKLKAIAKVKEQIPGVKHLIQTMESSSDIQGSTKQRNIIAETIMSLLLKLDTIQGLHPSIREVRKSVVRELVSLQEKLDSVMNSKSEISPRQESSMKCYEDGLNKTEDVIPSESGSETPSDLLETHQNQLGEGSGYENLEIAEVNPLREEATDKLEKEAAESCVTKQTESASAPTTENDDEKINQVLENSEISAAEEDHGSDLAELPIGVCDDLYSQEITDHRAVDIDASEDGLAKQLEGGLIEGPITPELHCGAADEENKEGVQIEEVSIVPYSQDNVNLEVEDTSQVNESLECNKIGDAEFEPHKCTGQQLDEISAGVFEPSGASDEREFPVAEASNPKCTACDKLHEDLPILEEALDTPPEKEILSQLIQGSNLEQEITPINESANTHAEADMTGVKAAAEDKSRDDKIDSGLCFTQQCHSVTDINGYAGVSEERDPKVMEASEVENKEPVNAAPEVVASEQGEEYNMEHSSPKENLEVANGKENAAYDEVDITTDEANDRSISQVVPTLSQVSLARDDTNESSQKLIEENERLRDIMEKLIKSGQEQLTAISSLSGRVKDLERRLSRKKKLKMKPYRAPRSGSSWRTAYDGCSKQSTIGVAS